MSSTLLVAERSLCCTVARLVYSLHAARLFHLLRQHLFHSAKISYANCSPAPLKLSAKSLLSPPSVWPLLHFLPARPHKYYPCTTNSIMRAVKRGKPTALSVFITLGRPGCKWKEIRGLLFLLMGRGRAGLASYLSHLNFSDF